MARTSSFDLHTEQYEEWFVINRFVYEAELEAVRQLLPEGRGVEIGVGSGLFAAPLHIREGVEPSAAMRRIAEKRGIKVENGVAEHLPYENNSFDFALMVTTVCFVDDVQQSFEEAARIIKPGGYFLVGFVDLSSPLGRFYEQNKAKSDFYGEATFFSVDEINRFLRQSGFNDFEYRQTVFHPLNEIEKQEEVNTGYGQGAFVVIRVRKSKGEE